MQFYINKQLELIAFYESELAKAVYKDAKIWYKNCLKLAKFELFLLKIAYKLSDFRIKMLKIY